MNQKGFGSENQKADLKERYVELRGTVSCVIIVCGIVYGLQPPFTVHHLSFDTLVI